MAAVWSTRFPSSGTATSDRRRPSTLLLRAALIGGCLAAVAMALWQGDPAGALRADPDLARLLRGMALIKASVVLAAVGAIAWRFGQAVSRRAAAAYLGGAWLVSGATAMIWQLNHIPLAATLFHAGAAGLLLVAWREGGGALRRLRLRRGAVAAE